MSLEKSKEMFLNGDKFDSMLIGLFIRLREDV